MCITPIGDTQFLKVAAKQICKVTVLMTVADKACIPSHRAYLASEMVHQEMVRHSRTLEEPRSGLMLVWLVGKKTAYFLQDSEIDAPRFFMVNRINA